MTRKYQTAFSTNHLLASVPLRRIVSTSHFAAVVFDREALFLPPFQGMERRGFTLVELLVTIGVIGILASLIIAACVRAKSNAHATACVNNLKQMQLASLGYGVDHDDSLPPNDGGLDAGKNSEQLSWVAGWLRTDLEVGGKYDATNQALLVAPEYEAFGSIGQYTRESRIYRCPSDRSVVTIEGVRIPRVRSVSMNAYLNGRNKWQDTNYLTYRRFGDIFAPSDTWAFTDEREDSINDGYFGVDMTSTYSIIDYPGSYHNGAGTFSFADGHCELHRWVEKTTKPPLIQGVHLPTGVKPTSATDRDVKWLVDHTTGRRSN